MREENLTLFPDQKQRASVIAESMPPGFGRRGVAAWFLGKPLDQDGKVAPKRVISDTNMCT